MKNITNLISRSGLFLVCVAILLLPMIASGGNPSVDGNERIAGEVPIFREAPEIVTYGELPCQGTRNELATPDPYGLGSGVGEGRAIGFQADSNFTISSVGIMGDLYNQSFDVVIYDSPDGHSAGSVLYTSTQTTGGTGYGWNDLAVSFNFTAGNYYVLNWRPTGGGSSWAANLNYFYDDALPFTIGPLTILEGMEGYNAESVSNFLHPHLRICSDAGSSCTLDYDLSYIGGTLSMNFLVGSSDPVFMNVWLSITNQLIPLWSIPIGAPDPAVSIPVSIPGFPSFGTIGILATLSAINEVNINCSNWQTVDTGPMQNDAEESLNNLIQKFQ